MKKLMLFIALLFVCSIGQAQFHNIEVNEKVHYQDDSLTSCYIVITDVNVPSISSLLAIYNIKVYKSKTKYEANPEWFIQAKEINQYIQIQFNASFTQGDLFYKLSSELKKKLLEINTTWSADNIVIEE